jgi:hypothetical protein
MFLDCQGELPDVEKSPDLADRVERERRTGVGWIFRIARGVGCTSVAPGAQRMFPAEAGALGDKSA